MRIDRAILTVGLLFLALASSWGTSLRTRAFPPRDFANWLPLQSVRNDAAIQQVWRQTLPDLPRDVTGYRMFSYQAGIATSPATAMKAAATLLDKERFSDYVAKGYVVTPEPWSPHGLHGMRYTVSGLDRTARPPHAQMANIYTWVAVQDTVVVWAEYRESATSGDIDGARRVIARAGGAEFAAQLVATARALWTTSEMPAAVLTPPSPMSGVTEPLVVPGDTATTAPSIPPAPASPVEPSPIPATPAATPAAVAPVPATPPSTPDTIPVALPPASATPAPSTPPAIPSVAPPASGPTPESPASSPPAPAPLAEAPRWCTVYGHLSCVLPASCRVTGDKPYLISGIPGVTVRIYPPDTYASEIERARAMNTFRDGQRDISVRDFSDKPVTYDDGHGVLTRYVNVDNQTVHAIYLAKSGRLWLIECQLAGPNATSRAALTELLDSLRID